MPLIPTPPAPEPRLNGMYRDRRGAIALITAMSMLPAMILVGMAIDFGFYFEAEARLNLAADAAALYAGRVAAQGFSAGGSSAAALAAGQTAGQQWFAAQAGQISTTVVPSYNATVALTFTQNPGGFSTTVSYTATVRSHLGAMLGYASYPVSGSASMVISNSYVEVVMLLDNSSSMLIGATLADIIALEKATPCSTQSAGAGQNMASYSWNYTGSYGYSTGNTPPPTTGTNGSCSSGYDGDPSVCFYAPTAIASQLNASGQCNNGGGASGAFGANTPQAPCAFACHNSSTNNDYYGLARSLGVTLRLDVVEQAAAGVIQTLQAKLQSPNQFLVGVYEFTETLSQVYPTSGSGEAGTDLAAALQAVQALSPIVTPNVADTNFPSSASSLNSIVTSAGDGTTQAGPLKNLFIVTDGMKNSLNAGLGPMTSATNEQTCQMFKNKGFIVYVLYTTYLPLPNPFYISIDKKYAEPTTSGGTSTNVAALQACATSPATYFEASDPAAIQDTMIKMLATALNSAGRVTK